MATLYPGGDEPPRLVHPTQGQRFALGELQAYVGGYIEAYYISVGSLRLLYNEDGIALRMPPNRAFHASHALPMSGQLVGPVLLVNPTEMPEDN